MRQKCYLTLAYLGITRSCMRWYVRKTFLTYQRIRDRVIPM